MLSFPQLWYVWQVATRWDRLPYPVVNPTGVTTMDDLSGQQMQVQQWWNTHEDPDLLGALRMVVDPALHVSVLGSAAQGWEVRMVGASEAGYAVLLHQHPHSGQVQVWAGGAPALASRVALNLPKSTPGQGSPVRAPTPQSHHTRTWHQEPVHQPRTQTLTTFLTQPQKLSALITVSDRGQSRENRLLRGCFGFVDIEGDGRYLLRPGHDEVVRPASTADIHQELHTLLSARRFYPY
ncbi:MAG: ESX secretion-associated protein EspG [Mycobacteriaceae bacterium]